MRFRLILPLLLLGSVLTTAQKPVPLKGTPPAAAAEDDKTEISFSSFSRMVVVDVIVKDSRGLPVHGLTADDFEVFEEGVAQRLASFNENADVIPASRPARAEEAAESLDFFTNADKKPQEATRPSIILLDLLNTPIADRQMARQALARFLQQRMKNNEPLALFVLGTHLELIQDFTSDAGLLKAAVTKQRSALNDPKADAMNSRLVIKAAELAEGSEFGAIYKEIAEAIVRLDNEVEAQRTTNRVETTLEALRSISRYSERSRGRKSLVWLSASFPFSIQTDMGLTHFETQLRQTSNQLSAAQLAVYPVDVRGMMTTNIQDLAQEPTHATLRESVTSNAKWFDAAHEVNSPQDSMREIADLTGGVAYLNRNDLDVAIASAMEDNRSSYMLGYYPRKKEFDNRFRRIKVRLKNRSVAELRYRRGYYALGFTVENKTTPDLIRALENDASVSSQITLVSRLMPTQPRAGVPFNVELFVKGGNIHYADVASKSAAFLDFAAVAVAPNGRTMARTWHRGELKLDNEKTQKAETAGLLYSLPLTLPAPGVYKVRAGIRDSFTGRIGTVEIPVTVK